jgi:hypothetical protein
MDSGTAAITGSAAATLNAPVPEKTLTITDLFPRETISFRQTGSRKPAAAASGHGWSTLSTDCRSHMSAVFYYMVTASL